MSLPIIFPEPPTETTLQDARQSLQDSVQSLDALSTKITEAEAALKQIVVDAQCAINDMFKEKSALEERVLHAQSYLAPIRRLPLELVREVFYCCFDDHPCIAWVLASVCKSWRRLSLGMPRIWSKIRLVTTQHSSADTIRLWLERSGSSVPLDIEIFLRVTKSSSESSSNPRTRRRSSSPSPAVYYPWPSYHPSVIAGGGGGGGPTHYVISHPSPGLPPATTPIVVPLPPSGHHVHDIWGSPSPPGFGERSLARSQRDAAAGASRGSTHWGYIAIFYLVEQMQRWERFVFRFDKQFASIGALKSIVGDAPLLKEFEISSAEAAFYPEWPWLPNMNPSAAQASGSSTPSAPMLQKLQSLTLQFTPFKWTSPMFHTSLHTLNLRALPTSHLPLDRVLHILHANKDSLRYLSIHFQSVTPAILPLNPLSLPELKELSVGGHYLLSQLVDTLILPSLEELNLDIEAREPIEEVIVSLVGRSGGAAIPIKHLSVAYGYGCGRRASKANEGLITSSSSKASGPSTPNSPTFYYGPGGIVIAWNILAELPQLESLRVGGTPMDTLLCALGVPDDDMLNGGGPGGLNAGSMPSGGMQWLCPNLLELGMKNCHAHSEGLTKLVQMVEARNPADSSGALVINGVAPTKLKSLELYECTTVGTDVVDWLKEKIEEVACTDLAFERSPISHHSFV